MEPLHNWKIMWRKFKMRFRIAKDILFNKKPHFFVVWVDRKNLVELIKQDAADQNYSKVTINFTWHGLQAYNVYKMVEIIYDQNDKIDMALNKADYEAQAILQSKQPEE